MLRADGSDDLFSGEQSHGHGSLRQSTHQRQGFFVDAQPQQATDVADQHQCFLVAADHRVVELNALFQLENAGGPTGKVHHFTEGEALKASIAAKQAETQFIDVLAGQGQQRNDGVAVQARGQETVNWAGLLASKFPAHLGDASPRAHRQQSRWWFDGQDYPCRRWCITNGAGIIEVQPAQHLGGDDLHLSISLDQHPTISGQCSQGLLTKQFRVRALAGRSFGHKGITAFHQACSPRGAEAFFQSFEFRHHRVQQLVPVVQEQLEALTFRSKLIQLLAQAFLFESGQAPQGHGQHRIGLTFAEVEAHHQAGAG